MLSHHYAERRPQHFVATGRVLRKHAFSRHMLFLDFVYSRDALSLCQSESDSVETDTDPETRASPCSPSAAATTTIDAATSITTPQYEFASIVLKRRSFDNEDEDGNVEEHHDEDEGRATDAEADADMELETDANQIEFVDEQDGEGVEETETPTTSSEAPLPHIIAGDVIRVRGIIQNFANFSSSHTARPSLFVLPHDVEVVHHWPVEQLGFFSFESTHFDFPDPATNFANAGALIYSLPSLVLQCRRQAITRILPVLKNILKNGVEVCVRESSTSFIKSSDRLLIIYFLGQWSQQQIIEKLISHPVLASAIMRIYSGQSASNLSVCCHASLDKVMHDFIDGLIHHEQSELVTGVRLQTFPKSLSTVIIEKSYHPLQDKTLIWAPREYSHVLSVYMLDGLWVVSLAPQLDAFIGDLREKPKDTSNNVQVAVCRAQAKLEEIMCRRDWITGSYRFAMDVGASPGGWTSFLAHYCDVKRIVSVDKGDVVLPVWPQHVAHWKMHGDEAISSLISDVEGNNVIDLYCCDANIIPIMSINMLLRCKDNQILAVGARIVITLKNIYGKKNEWEREVDRCLQTMKDQGFSEVELVHLLANTRKETTLTAVYRPVVT